MEKELLNSRKAGGNERWAPTWKAASTEGTRKRAWCENLALEVVGWSPWYPIIPGLTVLQCRCCTLIHEHMEGGGKPLQVTRKMWSRSGLHPWLLGMVFLHGVPRAGDTGGKLVGLSIVKPSWAAANSCVCWLGGVCVFLEQMNKSLSKFQALCKHPVERKTARLWNEREIRKIVGLC